IRAGRVAQGEARRLEQRCMKLLRAYDAGLEALNDVLASLLEYAALCGLERTRVEEYRATLEAQPWKKCPCDVCRDIGYHVILFRGAERNRRRGFHNIWTFYRRLQQEFGGAAPGEAISGDGRSGKRQLPLF